MSVQSEITRLTTAKSDISTAITNKGVTVPSGTKLDGMAALIDSIESGGGSTEPEYVTFKVYNDSNSRKLMITGMDEYGFPITLGTIDAESYGTITAYKPYTNDYAVRITVS